MMAPLFSAELIGISALYNVLRAVPVTEFAIFKPKEEGLKITIENSKYSEISIYLPTELFITYQLEPDAVLMFKVQFRTFIECLNIYEEQGNPNLKLTYAKLGDPFSLVMKHPEENMTIDCQFATLSMDDYDEVFLSDECNINSIVFKGEDFYDLLDDLDEISDDYDLTISNDEPHFRIVSTSPLGDSTVEILKTSPVVSVFNCKEEFKARYNFSNLREIMKVMALADKVSVSTGGSGLLGMNIIIEAGEKRLYLEYYFTAQFEDNEND